MTTSLFLITALALGAACPRRWLLGLPTVLAGLSLLALASSGHDVSDTPIPFLALVTTLGILLGGFFRPRRRESA